MNKRSGFGLMEVLVAAVVLAFLLVGLNTMQKGNRESILRIRARDGANIVAQNVIDSISALGPASVAIATAQCPEPFDENHDLCRVQEFAGTVSTKVPYSVTVDVKEADELQANEKFIDDIGTNVFNVNHTIAKRVDVTVKWNFKNSEQSINVSSIVR